MFNLLDVLKTKYNRKLQITIETVNNPIPSDIPNLPSSFGPAKFASPAATLKTNGKNRKG